MRDLSSGRTGFPPSVVRRWMARAFVAGAVTGLVVGLAYFLG